MTKKEAIKLFEERKVRTVWDDLSHFSFRLIRYRLKINLINMPKEI